MARARAEKGYVDEAVSYLNEKQFCLFHAFLAKITKCQILVDSGRISEAKQIQKDINDTQVNQLKPPPKLKYIEEDTYAIKFAQNIVSGYIKSAEGDTEGACIAFKEAANAAHSIGYHKEEGQALYYTYLEKRKQMDAALRDMVLKSPGMARKYVFPKESDYVAYLKTAKPNIR